MLALFDRIVAALTAAMGAAGDALLQRPWTPSKGEHVLTTIPTVASLRLWDISHLIHHRGELTMYLRLLDVPVPALHGPSADVR